MFHHDGLLIEIIDVFHFNRKKSKCHTPKRHFHILTKRIKGYTDITFDDNSYRATADKLLYIPADTEYVRQSYDDEEIIAIHFNILNRDFFAPFLIDVEAEKCDKAFKEIYRVWSERKIGFKYQCTAILCEYLASVMIEKCNSEEYDKLERSIYYIKNNLTRKISVSTLAKMCNLCETQYRKIFKKEFGVSPVKYINKLRVNRAISKLSSGYYSMVEIAEQCGFSEQKYFNKIFKSETGVSPSQYKREYLYREDL